MKKKILTLIAGMFMFLLGNYVIAQDVELDWATQIGGTGFDGGSSIAVDDDRNIYIFGYFQGTVDFDPGPGTVNLTSEGLYDAFVQKLNPSGDLVWVKQIEGSSLGGSLTMDNSGNIYLVASSGLNDFFVQKLNPSGDLVWVKYIEGNGLSAVFANSIAVDVMGNVYTTGMFTGTVDFDPGPGTMNLNTAAIYDIFIQKLDASGNLIWVEHMVGTGDEIYGSQANSITVDATGNVYTTGMFTGTVDFDPGTGITNLTTGDISNIFVQKLDASGDLAWVKHMAGTSLCIGNSIVVDENENIYISGQFWETTDFDPGPGTTNLTSAGISDIYIQKLDVSGNLIWVKQMGGTGYDNASSIAIDNMGNVYVTGGKNGTQTGFLLDMYFQKLDASGNLIWVKQMGGADHDTGQALAVDDLGNLYITGLFEGTVDFDPGQGTVNLTSAGGLDIFVQKLSQNTVGIIDYSFVKEIIIYPIPTNSEFTIDLGKNVMEDGYVLIYNSIGQLVYSQAIQDSSNTISIQLVGLSEGTYFVQLKDRDKYAVQPIFITHY